jgi:hypothetical protein
MRGHKNEPRGFAIQQGATRWRGCDRQDYPSHGLTADKLKQWLRPNPSPHFSRSCFGQGIRHVTVCLPRADARIQENVLSER